MKKLVSLLFGTALLVSTFGVISASAAPPEGKGPGPNGHNDKGLCTAYFNGQKNGHNKDGKDSPPPFAGLEDVADEADGEDDADNGDRLEIAGDVFGYCDGMIGGNPSNGRYDCIVDDEDGPTCAPGDGPGAEGKAKGKND